jgi:hypothetical protein
VTEEVLCLSVRQPWAWAIIDIGKDVENRIWKTRIRGSVLIHASQGCTTAEYDEAREFIYRACPSMFSPIEIPALSSLERGGIIGAVDLVDCVTTSNSPWFTGDYGFVLRNPRPLPFIPCKGALGFFACPADALALVQQAVLEGT